MSFDIPFLQPRPVRLSTLLAELEAIEASGIYTNYGPVNARFEKELVEQLFGGVGDCLTVNNATSGLMLAIREGMGDPPVEGRRFALMPSFTFAATAHAAVWAGLTPLFCDIDAANWTALPEAEEELLHRYRDQVAVVVPYATFGNGLDLERYDRLASKHGVSVVVDAAASLGALDDAGRGFGTGSRWPVVYSMHATKIFATAEAGAIHCADAARLARLRTMGNFGFGQPRTATMPGFNTKLSEVGALLGLATLENFEALVVHRAALADAYRSALPGWTFQKIVGRRQAYQFMPVLLPEGMEAQRGGILASLQERGIGTSHYFSPHLAEQEYFQRIGRMGDLSVTQRIAPRAVSLPMSDRMTRHDVETVCAALLDATDTRR